MPAMSDSGTRGAQGSPFWRFSLGFYRRPGVAQACIELQDQCGVDVNFMLFLLWLAFEKRRLSEADVEMVWDKVRGWNADVVVPLRKLRRMLKSDAPLVEPGPAELFRTKIKGIELEAERLQQEAMFELAQRLPLAEAASAAEDAARANISAYQRVAGREFLHVPIAVLLAGLADAERR